ncbi:phage portal protein, HK97 family [Thermomonospora echinospora]|uniref:Phage portal protein, HK97 family n=1 Tax=Thermomonospora echinospora TaxID=1992 RepID=A0A1H6A9B3_9ACTN|nr:phage portal protein [Thermomonospora echinospora]SEG44794.1 phage portal protein, HK97 family [Thermomonospora echinospora]
MSLFSRRHAALTVLADQLIPARPQRSGTPTVTQETALRHSAVWACLRLRADLVSTMPVDVFRRVARRQVEVPRPPVLVAPGATVITTNGDRVDLGEWLYATQMDLDRGGNVFGLITERDGMGLPARIDLVPLADVTVVIRDGVLTYRIAGTKYEPHQVWHERQFTVAGLPVGLSPVAYAAWSIGEYLSVQDFALDWFGSGAIPSAHLKNTVKQTLTAGEASVAKERFKAAVEGRDLFVTGSDWEYSMIQAEAAGADWLEAKRFGIGDIARFFGCPGDLIDAAVSTGSITYANITQRNLQFLIMNLGPTIIRRENALSRRLLPQPRFVKFNTDALLRMDPQTRAQTIKTQLDARILAPSEARELDNRPPFTDQQLAEFDRLYGVPRTQPSTAAATGVTP